MQVRTRNLLIIWIPVRGAIDVQASQNCCAPSAVLICGLGKPDAPSSDVKHERLSVVWTSKRNVQGTAQARDKYTVWSTRCFSIASSASASACVSQGSGIVESSIERLLAAKYEVGRERDGRAEHQWVHGTVLSREEFDQHERDEAVADAV